MADNEEETVRTIKSYRKVLEGHITEYRGRLVDSPAITCWLSLPA
jgi:hypothetical protein